MNRNVLISFCVVLVAGTAYGQFPNSVARKPAVPEVDQQCMDCICQASSNCDTTIKCHNSGGAYFCGPYVVSWAYWHDGGRPGDKGRAHDFENCLNNKTCAELAVRGYMRKNGRDCDRDSSVTCYDFARIHKLGYGDCGNTAIENSDYWEKFLVCYEGYPPGSQDDVPPAYDYGEEVIDARHSPQG